MVITKVAFVAFAVDDPQKVAAFYKDTLGLQTGEFDVDAWVELDVPDGSTLAFVREPGVGNGYIALETDDIEAEVERLRGLGVEIVREVLPPLSDDEPPFCREAWIKDPAGNLIKLHQRLAE